MPSSSPCSAPRRSTGAGHHPLRTKGKAGQYSYEQRHSIELSDAGARALRANKAAAKYFEAQAPSYRAAAKHWVMSAKKEETREKRLQLLIESSEVGRPIPPMRWAKKKS